MAYFREKNGSWEYTVTAGRDPVTKKYNRIVKSGFRTKTAAKQEARRVEEEIKQGVYVKESQMTFGEFFETWLSHYEKRAKVSSVRARKIAAKRLLDEWQHHSIGSITATIYQERIDALSETFSANYIDSIHSTGRMIFNFAEKKNLIRHNPTNHFEKPRMLIDEVKDEVDEMENFLEIDELAEFLLLVKEKGLPGDLVMFTTLAYSGLRIGELVALKESDLGMTTGELSVTKTYYNPKNNKKEFMLLSPKNKGSKRKLELDPFVVELIKGHLKQQKEIKMKYRNIYNDQSFIFADNEGYPPTIKKVAIRLQRLMQMMDTEKHITPHSFRHTNISLLIEAKVPLEEIQRRIGHTDFTTTMNVYNHISKGTKTTSSQLFSQHLSKLTEKLQ